MKLIYNCFITLFAVLLIATIIGTYFVGQAAPAAATTPEPQGPSASLMLASAEASCQEAVRNRMKAPSTTQFPGEMNVKIATDKKGLKHYLITGLVDSQNSFGAMLRKPYLCEVVHESDSRASGDDFVKHVVL